MALSVNVAGGHVFLDTASIFVVDNLGEYRKCGLILDSGSPINFILSKFVNLLQDLSRNEVLPVSSIRAKWV